MLFLKRLIANKGTLLMAKFTILLLVAVIGLCVWIFRPPMVYVLADSLTYNSPDGTYQYSTTHHTTGFTDIEVTFDMNWASAHFSEQKRNLGSQTAS